MSPTPPNLDGQSLQFDPISYWVTDGLLTDPAAFTAALKRQPALADFADGNGNMQSAVRLDYDADPANVGFWVTVPKGTPESVVQAAVDVIDPPPPPPPPDPFVPASVAVQTAVAAAVATVAITSPNLTPAQLAAIQTQVTAKVQAVIDQHVNGA